MTLLDLMNVYRLKKNNDNIFSLLLEMFDAANIDSRIDRDILAGRMLTDCGRREPRYNTTDTFLFFGSVWLKSKNENITKTLDLLAIQYNPLNEYEEHKTENIDREHITNGSETKTRDVDTTDDFTSTTSESATSEEQRNGEEQTSGEEERNEQISKTTTTAETKSNNATDEHFVSAENESAAQLRTRDTHTETIGDNTTVSESGTNAITAENSETTTSEETTTREDSSTGTKTNSDHEVIDEDVRTSHADTTTHDDTIDTTITGHKTAQAELIRAELEKAKLNIYDQLIDDFADIMFINVF